MAADEVVIKIKATDRASGVIDKIGRKMGGLGGVASKMGKVVRMGALAGGAGLAIAAVGVIKLGASFDEAYDTIRTGTGATGEVLEGLKTSMKNVFKSIPTDLQPAAAAISDFNTLTGATGSVLEGMAKRALEAARVLGEDSAALVTSAGKALNIFEVDGERSNAMLDAMFVASQKTGIPMTKLASTLQTYGPVLKNLGFGMTESIALFSSLDKAGIDVSRVMPGLNAFMRKLADEGVTELDEALYGVIDQIKNATTDSEALNLATQAFGAEGAQRMSVAIRTGALDLEELQTAMENSENAILDTAKANESFGEKFTKMKNRVMVAIEPLATKGFEMLGKAMDALAPHMDKFTAWMEENLPPAMEKAEEVISAVREALTPFFEAFVDGLKIIMPKLKQFGEWIVNNKPVLIIAIAAIGLAIVAAFGPVSLAIVAIVGIITALGYFSENWEEVKEKITGAIDNIMSKVSELPFIGEVFDILVSVITEKVQAIVAYIQSIIDIGKNVISFFQNVFKGDWDAAWEDLKNIATGVLTAFYNWIDLVFLSNFRGLLKALKPWEWIKPGLEGLVEGAKGVFTSVRDWVRDHWKEIMLVAIGGIPLLLLVKFREKIGEAISTGAQKLLDLGTEIIDWIKMGLNALPGMALGLISDFISGLWDAVIAKASDLLGIGGYVKDKIGEGLGKLIGKSPSPFGIEIGLSLVEGIIKGTEEKIPHLRESLRTLGYTLSEDMSIVPLSFYELGGETFEQFMKGMGEKTELLRKKLRGIGVTIAEDMTVVPLGFYDTGVASVQYMAHAFEAKQGEIGEVLRQFGFTMAEDMSIVPLSFYGIGEDAAGALTTGITREGQRRSGPMAQNVSGAIGGALAYWAGFDRAGAWGESIAGYTMSGIWRGFHESWDAWAEAIAGIIYEGLMDALGAASPAKKMIPLGAMAAQGYALGFKRALTPMSLSASALTTSSALLAGPVRAGVRGQPEVHVHYHEPLLGDKRYAEDQARRTMDAMRRELQHGY